MGPAFAANLRPRGRRARAARRPMTGPPSGSSSALKEVAEAHGLKLGDAMQPVRVALTGSTVSEPVNELLAVVGPRAAASRALREVAPPSASGEPERARRDPPRRPRAGLVAGLAACARQPATRRTPTRARARADTAAPPPRSALIAPPPPPRPTRRPSVRLAFVGDINLGTATLPDGVPPDSGRGLLDAARPPSRATSSWATSRACWPTPARRTSASAMRAARRPGRHPPPAPRRPLADTAESSGPAATPSARRPRSPPGWWKPGSPTSTWPTTTPTTSVRPAAPPPSAILDSLGLRLYGRSAGSRSTRVRRGDSLTTVGLIGFTTYPFAYDLLDIARSAAVVDSVRPLVDLLVVTFHGGAEGVGALHVPEAAESLGREPRGDLRRWARAVIDAGADAVWATDPTCSAGSSSTAAA